MGIVSDKIVKTRKEHQCSGCARILPKQTKMQVVNHSDGGKLSTSYWCKTCQSYWDKYMDGDDEISIGDLKNEDSEGWEEIRKTIEN